MKRRTSSTIMAVLFTVFAAPAESQTLRFSGFGDLVLGATSGENVDKEASDKFVRFDPTRIRSTRIEGSDSRAPISSSLPT